jgi:hypothetical protein
MSMRERVPRLLPRLTAARFDGLDAAGAGFRAERYMHHREYNAAMGAGVIYAALVLRMLLRGRL